MKTSCIWSILLHSIIIYQAHKTGHTSKKRGLRSTFWSPKMLQNLPYLWKKKTHVVFFVFHLEQLWVLLYECPFTMVWRSNQTVVWRYNQTRNGHYLQEVATFAKLSIFPSPIPKSGLDDPCHNSGVTQLSKS